MKIINARPPNFDLIARTFPMAFGRHVIFAYHDAIYAPFVRDIPAALIAHELVHLKRQGGSEVSTVLWWERYCADPVFRFEEEVLSHKAEYEFMIGEQSNRKMRQSALKLVAKKLSSPLYGRMINETQARQLLKGNDNEAI